jgi:hypothetical protein
MKTILHFLSISILLVAFISCEEKEENPEVVTSKITALSASRFYAKATIPDKGNIDIVDYGFVYYVGTSSATYGNSAKISLGKELKTDTFSTIISLENFNYYPNDYNCYVKAYLTNEKGTIYGKELNAPILRLQATSIYPTSAKVGDTITIKGSNFALEPDQNKVTFNNVIAQVISATSTTLKVKVPAVTTNSYDSYVYVRIQSGGQTIDLNYNVTILPSPTGFYPKNGTWGTTITISGNSLGSGTVYFNDVASSYYSSYNNSITVNVPSDINVKSFKLYIAKNGIKTEVPGGSFSMNKLQVTSYTPKKLSIGSVITVSGTNLNPYYNLNRLLIGNLVLSSNYYSNMTFSIPSSLSKGEYAASVTNGIDTVALPGKIEIVESEFTSVTPTSGYAGTKITINGANFSPNNTSVYLGSAYIGYSSMDSSTIKATIPFMEPGTYNFIFNINSVQYKSALKYTVLAPVLSAISPSSGTAGTSVIITGEGFGTSTSNINVWFGSLYADVMSMTNTQLNVKVPSSISKGTWMVKLSVNGYQVPNTLTFEVP